MLRRHVTWCLANGKPVELLAKLAGREEDQWGTQVALLSSEFGDVRDLASKRPCLDLEIHLPFEMTSFDHDFVLEGGMELELPPIESLGGDVLVAASVTGGGTGAAPPLLSLRGGRGAGPPDAWSPLTLPVRRRDTWLQIKVAAAPHVIELGTSFRVELREPWVSPGPRELQLPELVAIAPSGALHRVSGQPEDSVRYVVSLEPEELGLWRYGWSYLPWEAIPPGAHQGEGLFFVRVPRGRGEEEALETLARSVEESARRGGASDPILQYQWNAFLRSVSESEVAGRLPPERADALVKRVRGALVGRLDERR
jgi:hypothetical protein